MPRTTTPHGINNSPSALSAFSEGIRAHGERRSADLLALGQELLARKRIALSDPEEGSSLRQLAVLSQDEKSIEIWIIGAENRAFQFSPTQTIEIDSTEELIKKARTLQGS